MNHAAFACGEFHFVTRQDVVSLNEVDEYAQFADFFAPYGYEGVYAKKRSPAKDGVAIFWKCAKLEPAGCERAIWFETYSTTVKREQCAQVALRQDLRFREVGVVRRGVSV